MAETRFYRHYKNKPYKYLGLVFHSETLEQLVLYEALYENANGRLWVRPKDMFFEKIEKNNQLIDRFEPVTFQLSEFESLAETEKQIIQELLVKTLGAVDLEKWHRKIKQFTNVHAIIAFDRDQPVAFKIGYAINDQTFYSWYGGVLPEYRQLGLGSLLIEKQHEWCRRKKFLKVTTKTTNSKTQMIQLNLKAGLQIVGTEMDQQGQLKILFEKLIN